MPYDELIIHAGNLGGMVFAYPPTGRCCIVIDEDATEEEAQDTIKWAREALKTDNLEPTPWEIFLKYFGLAGG